MTFSTRLGLFVCISIAGIVAWYWNAAADTSREATQLAVQQFQNSDAVPATLQQASVLQNWWPLIWPAALLVIGITMFWEDAERWLTKSV